MSKTIIERDYWNDEKVISEFSPEDKYFMIYLLTCPKGNSIGIFKLPVKIIAFEMGYSVDSIKSLIDRFDKKYSRIAYDYESQEIAILNSLKYTISKGGKPVEDMIARELNQVTNSKLIERVYQKLLPWWNKSSRLVDENIKFKFETEILKRKEAKENTTNANANANANTDSHNDSYHDSSKDDDFNIIQDEDDSLHDTYHDSYDDTSKASSNYQEIIDFWNDLDENIPKLEALNSGTKRYKMLQARINQYGEDKIFEAIDKIGDSKFLKGYVTDFTITFDWFIRPNNFIKVLEGNYTDKEESNHRAFIGNKKTAGERFKERLEKRNGRFY